MKSVQNSTVSRGSLDEMKTTLTKPIEQPEDDDAEGMSRPTRKVRNRPTRKATERQIRKATSPAIRQTATSRPGKRTGRSMPSRRRRNQEGRNEPAEEEEGRPLPSDRCQTADENRWHYPQTLAPAQFGGAPRHTPPTCAAFYRLLQHNATWQQLTIHVLGRRRQRCSRITPQHSHVSKLSTKRRRINYVFQSGQHMAQVEGRPCRGQCD